MIVVHAAWLEDQLVVWGESPRDSAAAAAGSPPSPRGTRPRKGRKTPAPGAAPRPSPYDAGAARLAEALSQAAAGLSVAARAAEPFVAWLPTRGGNPVASSPLVADPDTEAQSNGKAQGGAEPVVSPWSVSGFVLGTEQALDLLAAAIGRTTMAQGVVVGASLSYWAIALRFAAAMVARQQFLPGVVKRVTRPEGESKKTGRLAGMQASYHARWEPIITGADAQRMARLVQGLPPVCRALSHHAEVDGPPTRSGAEAVASFLAAMVDHLVRTSAPKPRPPGRFDSLHDQWIHALLADDDRLDGQSEELEQLAEQVDRWRRPILVAAAAPLRLCFRLEEPVPDHRAGDEASPAGGPTPARDDWTVRYLVQAADDPSLIVPVSGLWRPGSRETALLERVRKARGFQPREFLLEALGRAARVDPQVEASLKAKTPGDYQVDARGAFDFLSQKAWLLEQAGFGVMLPAWWSRKGTKLRLTARGQVQSPKLRSQAGLSLDQVLRFHWQVALGD